MTALLLLYNVTIFDFKNKVQSTGGFKMKIIISKLRVINRKRNYFFKKIKNNIRLKLANIIWGQVEKKHWNIEKIKTILIIRNEGTVGDVIVYSSLIEKLSLIGFQVDLLLTESNKIVVENNPYIRNVYISRNLSTEEFLKSFDHFISKKTIAELKENNYDLVIDPCLEFPVHRMKLLKDINAKSVLGFNKPHDIKCYSKSINFDNLNNHITESVRLIACTLGINEFTSIPYKLKIPTKIKSEVKAFLHNLNGDKNVLINIFAGNKERCLSQDQLSLLIDKILEKNNKIRIVLLDHLNKINIIMNHSVVINPFKTIHHVMALISECDLIITPDTSIVHISAAWEKPLISIYKDVDDNNTLWAPGYNNASQLIFHCRLLSQCNEIPYEIVNEIEKKSLLNVL